MSATPPDGDFPGFEPTPEEKLEATRRMIARFFDDLADRVEFLQTLRDTGHEDDAFLLACCYIDGIAAWWRGGNKPRKRFARVLAKHGGESTLDRRKVEELYQHFRNRHVHRLGRYYDESWGMLLGIRHVDFETLHRALLRLVEAAREESLSKGILFGRKLTYE